jgi:short-subunit dehydrogenase
VKIAYQKMLKHKIEIIPGIQNKVTVGLCKMFPKNLVLKAAAKQLKWKTKSGG